MSCSNNPKLTIAIPTYNRLQALKQSLPRVLTMVEGVDIEVFVSDNASNDGTKEYIEKMQCEHPKLRYYRSEVNLGPDNNFLNCFEKANGDYLWMIGDDDLITNDAIYCVIDAISYSPVFVYLNTRMQGVDKSHYPDIGMLCYKDKNKFLREIGIAISFITALVYKTDLVKQIRNKKRFISGFQILTHIAIASMKKNGTYIIVTKNCADCTPNYHISYDYYHAFIHEWYNVIYRTAIDAGFDKKNLDVIMHNSLRTTILETLISFRKTDTNAITWNEEYAWGVIKKIPDLIPLYNIAIKTPREEIEKHRREIEKLQRKSIELEDIIYFARNYKKIYLYGIGVRADIIYNILKDVNINVYGAIISDGEKKKKFHDIPVIYISDLQSLSDDCGVIITLTSYVGWCVYDLIRKKINYENIHLQKILWTTH